MYAIVIEGKAIGQATGLVLDEDLRVIDIYYSEYDPRKGYTTHWRKNTPEGVVLSRRNGGFAISPIEGKRTHHGKGDLRSLFAKFGYPTLVGSVNELDGAAMIPSVKLQKALVAANAKFAI